MSAVEAPVVATEAKTEQTQHTRPQRPQYTRSQDVVIPPKPEKVSAPNEEEFKKRVEELETQITAARKRVEDIRGSFSKGTTKDAAFAERTAAREKLQAAQKITRAKGDELNAARAKLKEAQNARDVAIAEETKMKGQMKLTDLKAIERKVAEIDERLTTETLSLPEEKKLIAEREALNATKPMVQALQKKHEDIIAKKKVISEIFDTVKALGEEFNTLKEEEKKLRDSFEAIKARQAESAKEQPSMADELKVAKEKRDLLIASLQAIRDDYHKKAREFRNYERLLRDHQFAKRRKEQLERAEEYKSREEARKAEEASFDPLAAKRELCLTLIASLERMQPDHAARKAEAAALDVSTLPQQLGGKAGHFVVSKKFSQEPIQLLKAKPKAAEKTEEKKPAAEQPLKLPLPLIHQFAELHLSPPATAAAVPATLTQLREKAEYFAAQSAAAAQKAAEAKAAAATAEPVAAAPATEAQDEIPAEPQSMPDVSDS